MSQPRNVCTLDAEAAHQHIQRPHVRHLKAHVPARRTSPHRDVPQLHDTWPDCEIRNRLVSEPHGAAAAATS